MFMKDFKNKKGASPDLLEILVCPTDKGKLEYNDKENNLLCLKCGEKYEIKDNIPILLKSSSKN